MHREETEAERGYVSRKVGSQFWHLISDIIEMDTPTRERPGVVARTE